MSSTSKEWKIRIKDLPEILRRATKPNSDRSAVFSARLDRKWSDSDGSKVELSDKTGTIVGILSVACDDSLIGKAVIASGTLFSYGEGVVINILAIREAQENEATALELSEGIDKAAVDLYTKRMATLVKAVKRDSFRALLQQAFTKSRLEKYQSMPATLVGYGNYKGGLLASVINITEMALAMAETYEAFGNGLYTGNVDRDLIITAGLLLGYGIMAYRNPETWQKTDFGVQMGPQRCLEYLLTEIVREKKIPLTPLDLALIYNVQSEAGLLKSGVKTTMKEGRILAAAARCYSSCDMFDQELQRLESEQVPVLDEEGQEVTDHYFFSEKLQCYLRRNEAKGVLPGKGDSGGNP